MPTIVFGKIKTNRYTLLKYLTEFKAKKEPDESFIAPRPLPGNLPSDYYGITAITVGSSNYSFFTKLKTFQVITEEHYKTELNSIKYKWTA